MTEQPKRFKPAQKGHMVTLSPIMSGVPAAAEDPWWLPYDGILLAHLRQPFQLHLYRLPVYWTLTECHVQPHSYWKDFVIWEIASNKVHKARAPTYASYRFQLDGAIEAEQPCVISWMRPLCCDVRWCSQARCTRRQAALLSTLAHSCFQLWNLKGPLPPAHPRWVCAGLIFAVEEAELGGSCSGGYASCLQQSPE